jgi:Rrf2 family protein
MRFTAQEEYGLRCMLQLARHAPAPPASLSVGEIADHESLTPAYVAKLLRVLREAGLVCATRGQKGGYHLPRPAAEITVGQVLVALGGKLYSPEFCDRHAGTTTSCVHSTECSIRTLWDGLDRIVHSVLDRTSLVDLLDAHSPDAWVRRALTGIGRALPVAPPAEAAVP